MTKVPELRETYRWFTPGILSDNAEIIGLPALADKIEAELQTEFYINMFDSLMDNYTTTDFKEEVPAGDMVFCLTGTFDVPKAEIHGKIEAAGQTYLPSFNTKVTHLVAADPNSGSAKLKKAAKAGVVILSLEELYALLT